MTTKEQTLNAVTITSALRSLGEPEHAENSQRYFKTGDGEYGAGDRFLGIRVPDLRKHVSRYRTTPFEEVEKLLHSPWHEERLFALLLLVAKYQKGGEEEREEVYRRYMDNTAYVNNWDLVDSSAPYIVGPYLEARDKEILYAFARSQNLWERRIAILSTFHYIKNGRFNVSLELAGLLLHDKEDLIHKAVGWMLREIGKRDEAAEKAFLKTRYKTMPRTMLRYAIERFPETERKRYLQGTL